MLIAMEIAEGAKSVKKLGGIDRMSMISEQVTELKWYASYQDCEKVKKMMYKAANTIESLSAKLQAANMERSVDCGGWIPCMERAFRTI